MKAIVTYILIFTGCLGQGILAQEMETVVHGLRFFEMLAQRDADYESSFQMAHAQDEHDYWVDQRNYERHLGKADFTAYLVYMRGKKQAYHRHLQDCDTTCSHSLTYYQRAQEYLSASNTEYFTGEEEFRVVQNLTRKRNRQ